MAVTFIAPHSLHARPLVVPRGPDVTLVNRTPDVQVAVLVDGREVASVSAGGEIAVRLSPQRSLLATLPETTFFGRYRETFTSHPCSGRVLRTRPRETELRATESAVSVALRAVLLVDVPGEATAPSRPVVPVAGPGAGSASG